MTTSEKAVRASQALRAIHDNRGDCVVVAAGAPLAGWSAVSQRRDLDIDLTDCVGRAPALALGLALAQPQRKVLTLDSDSALRTSLDTLATVGAAGAENLVHFLLCDSDDRSTGGGVIPGLGKLDFPALAENGGYNAVFSFDSLEDLVLGIPEVMEAPGPAFVSIKVFYDSESTDHSRVGNTRDSLWNVREYLVSGPTDSD